MMNGSQRDGAPQMMSSPQYSVNMNPTPNYWAGNQMVVPGMQGQDPTQGLAAMLHGSWQDRAQQNAQESQKGGIDPMIGGLFGLIPGLIAGGGGGMSLGRNGISGILGGLTGGGLSALFK